jgi:hypothetical protein
MEWFLPGYCIELSEQSTNPILGMSAILFLRCSRRLRKFLECFKASTPSADFSFSATDFILCYLNMMIWKLKGWQFYAVYLWNLLTQIWSEFPAFCRITIEFVYPNLWQTSRVLIAFRFYMLLWGLTAASELFYAPVCRSVVLFSNWNTGAWFTPCGIRLSISTTRAK